MVVAVVVEPTTAYQHPAVALAPTGRYLSIIDLLRFHERNFLLLIDRGNVFHGNGDR